METIHSGTYRAAWLQSTGFQAWVVRRPPCRGRVPGGLRRLVWSGSLSNNIIVDIDIAWKGKGSSTMTNKIRAINALRPRISVLPMIDTRTLEAYVAQRANMSVADVSHALRELHFAILWFCQIGHSVKLDGLGVYTPAIDLDGTKTMNYRIDRELLRQMSIGHFMGRIENPENIGKNADELAALWDQLHPDEPVEP